MATKRKTPPLGGDGALKCLELAAFDGSENTPSLPRLQAQRIADLAFSPHGLLPMQAEAHRRDVLARWRLGLPLRGFSGEGRK